MNERERAQACFYTMQIMTKHLWMKEFNARTLGYEFNSCKPLNSIRQKKLLQQVIGHIKGEFTIIAPLWCDYGYNISRRIDSYVSGYW